MANEIANMFHLPLGNTWADPEGGQGVSENSQNIGFLSNTGPDSLENHKVTKPTFNVGQSSTRQRWRADVDPFIVVFESCTSSST